jgi:hypothetical protein
MGLGSWIKSNHPTTEKPIRLGWSAARSLATDEKIDQNAINQAVAGVLGISLDTGKKSRYVSDVEWTEEMATVAKNEAVSKNERFRQLYLLGVGAGQTMRQMNIKTRQQVVNAIKRMNNKTT